jgi:ribosomal protein L11 methyltransferase
VADISELPARADLVVELTVPIGLGELAADRLWAAGATALEWRDGDGTATLVASFPTPEATALVAEEVGGTVTSLDGSWRDAWREFAEPVEVGGLVVAPAWRDVPVAGGRLVVRIDPGWTFGSGTHASTRLVLGILDRDPPAGATVLDVGSGSGILSVAAALLGASAVDAIDIDPDAVRVTAANAEANQVGERVRAAGTPVAELDGRWEVGLVNVTAGVHAEIGSHVAGVIVPGGRLILAGLLPGQWRHVASAYPGTTVVERPVLDGWEGVVLRRDG